MKSIQVTVLLNFTNIQTLINAKTIRLPLKAIAAPSGPKLGMSHNAVAT